MFQLSGPKPPRGPVSQISLHEIFSECFPQLLWVAEAGPPGYFSLSPGSRPRSLYLCGRDECVWRDAEVSEEVTTGFWRPKTHSKAPGFWNTTVCMAPRVRLLERTRPWTWSASCRRGSACALRPAPCALRPVRPHLFSEALHVLVLGSAPAFVLRSSSPRPILTLTLDPAPH